MPLRCVLAIALLVGCDRDPESAEPAPVATASAATAMHGGSLVTVGAHRVELRAHRSGEIFGYLMLPDGSVVPSPEGALMTVTLTVDEDHPRPVLLRWNAERERYEARLRQEPLEGPADVRLMLAGEVEHGSIDRLPVDEALAESGVAYAESDEASQDEGEGEPVDGAAEEAQRSSGRGGIRARARRLFGL